MPLDPMIQAMLAKAAHLPPTHTLSVPDARARYDALVPVLPPAPPVAKVAEQTIPGPGGPLKLRIYTPPGTGPFPVVVFFHGSGFVLCSLDTHDGMCRNLCAGAAALVISVDYRLAPEHRFPAAPDDCLFATRWAAQHAAALNGDPTRLAVAGDSAGGNLAAVTALRIRDEGGPTLAAQLLIYPATAHCTSSMPSYAENAEGYGLTRATMEWFWAHYADPTAATHPHAAPLEAPNLAGLPPALVQTAEYDPLRDEGDRYAQRLREAGVAVQHSSWAGMNHGFLFWAGKLPKASEAMDEATTWLRARLERK
jgi:acetyl esterase